MNAPPQPTASFATAIETRYHGILYRSRSEARWAVFFDSFQVPFFYEPETYKFVLSETKTVFYLPDFWLPVQDCFIEVKGPSPNTEEQTKAKLLAKATNKKVYIFWGGMPSVTPAGQTRYDGGGTPDAQRLGNSVTSAWLFAPHNITKRTVKGKITVKGEPTAFHHWAICPKCGLKNIVLEGNVQLLTQACGCPTQRLFTQQGRAPRNPLATAYNSARAERFGS